MEQEIASIEIACSELGITPLEAVKAAGLHRATWFRWKSGSSFPTLRSLTAVKAAIIQRSKVLRLTGEPSGKLA